MTQGTLKIHSENILPIIKQWMYSDKEIFVRELISNACDALSKVKRLRDEGEVDVSDSEFRIEVRVDREAKTLTFSDTGIGMSADEVEKYIAQIAFSGAEEFVEKYKGNSEGEQIIGHFGLGFYSSYMVADQVEIDSLSYRSGSEAAHWVCDGSPEYTLDAGKRSARGTEITLHVSDDEAEFLDETRIRGILTRYCTFLPYPLFLNDDQINKQQPLWAKPASECSDQDYLEFYRHLYPGDPEPLFWIHLNVDYPFHLKGILYFPKKLRDFEENRHNIQLYCNRVFVSDDCRDIVPEYLLGLRGCIESPDIPLNVSRSYLQVDRTVRQLSAHVAKKVADRLSQLHKTETDRFYECWKDLEIIVKLGAMQDEKFFGRVEDLLVWKNTHGEWTTAKDYLERNKDKNSGKIFYTGEEKEQSQFVKLYEDQGLEILRTRPVIDGMFINFLEGKLENAKFQRIDGGLDDSILDPDREKSILDSEGRSESGRIAELIRKQIGEETLEVQAKSLKSEEVPGFIMIEEEARRMRDYMLSANPDITPEQWHALSQRKFVVNTNHKLVALLPELDEKQPELAKEVTCHLYQLALLSQREMSPDQLSDFVARSGTVLTDLTEKLLKG